MVTLKTIVALGVAISLVLSLVYIFVAMKPGPAKPKKSAITDPPWPSDGTVSNIFVCTTCGHEDGSVGDVAKCANCGLNLLRFRSR